ncbi:hypothetical protein AB4308_09880 [Vibrio breoganii]
MNHKHIIKAIQMGIATTALMGGMALANTTDLVESTDMARAEAHVSNVETAQQVQAEAATHQKALQTLESNGDVDQYIETNEAGVAPVGHVSECENPAITSGSKIAEHCR